MKYNLETKLYDLPDHEFETGGIIGEAVKAAGYIDGGRSVVNSNHWWHRELGSVLESLKAEQEQ